MPRSTDLPRPLAPSAPLTAALEALLRAHAYAADVGGDPWQFAVEWRVLRSLRLERADLRWLVARGFVELRREVSPPGALRRTFEELADPRLAADTACRLTAAGIAFARKTLASPADSQPRPKLPPLDSTPNGTPATNGKKLNGGTPHWDKGRRELRFHDILVKRYRVPAQNQELILDAFQEEGWPEFIDDPLPPTHDIDPTRRLQATVKALNRNQTNPLLRFGGNGGKKVVWRGVG